MRPRGLNARRSRSPFYLLGLRLEDDFEGWEIILTESAFHILAAFGVADCCSEDLARS